VKARKWYRALPGAGIEKLNKISGFIQKLKRMEAESEKFRLNMESKMDLVKSELEYVMKHLKHTTKIAKAMGIKELKDGLQSEYNKFGEQLKEVYKKPVGTFDANFENGLDAFYTKVDRYYTFVQKVTSIRSDPAKAPHLAKIGERILRHISSEEFDKLKELLKLFEKVYLHRWNFPSTTIFDTLLEQLNNGDDEGVLTALASARSKKRRF